MESNQVEPNLSDSNCSEPNPPDSKRVELSPPVSSSLTTVSRDSKLFDPGLPDSNPLEQSLPDSRSLEHCLSDSITLEHNLPDSDAIKLCISGPHSKVIQSDSTSTSPSLKSLSQNKLPTYKYKTVSAMNFRCIHCDRVFTVEQCFKKHLLKDHMINEEIPIGHYNSFIGKRKIRVRLDSTTTVQPVADLGENTMKEAPTVLNCSMCDKTFLRREGLKRHMKSFHKIQDVSTSLIKEKNNNISGKKVTPVFKTPHIVQVSSRQTSSSLSVFSSKLTSAPTAKTNPMATPTPATKTTSLALATVENMMMQRTTTQSDPTQNSSTNQSSKNKINKQAVDAKGKKKDKPKVKYPYCKTISNPFCSGGVRLESFSMWNNQGLLKTNKENKSLPNKNIEENANETEPSEPNSSITNIKETEPAENNLTEEENEIVSASDPAISSSPLDVLIIARDNEVRSRRPKEKNGAKKRTRTCGTPNCLPCSVLSDCGDCQNCLNKSLKQRCKKRQCHILNPRIKRKEPAREAFEVIEFEEIIDNTANAPGEQKLKDTDSTETIDEIVADIISESFRKVESRNDSNSQIEPKASEKPKKYKCEKCGKPFAQLTSAQKHCKNLDKSVKCLICDMNISDKKNLKRHILNCHEKSKPEKTPKVIPKCDLCDKTFVMRHKLKEHMKYKHGLQDEKGEEIHNCSECDFQNTCLSRIKAHFTKVHIKSPGTFRCIICDNDFQSRDGLAKHSKKNHDLLDVNLSPCLTDQDINLNYFLASNGIEISDLDSATTINGDQTTPVTPHHAKEAPTTRLPSSTSATESVELGDTSSAKDRTEQLQMTPGLVNHMAGQINYSPGFELINTEEESLCSSELSSGSRVASTCEVQVGDLVAAHFAAVPSITTENYITYLNM